MTLLMLVKFISGVLIGIAGAAAYDKRQSSKKNSKK